MFGFGFENAAMQEVSHEIRSIGLHSARLVKGLTQQRSR